jgi:hypothetical protein
MPLAPGLGVLGGPHEGRARQAAAPSDVRGFASDANQLATTDFINRDDPAQAKLETDRKAALVELERVKKDMTDQTKAIAAIEEEARRAGVPAGWLR